MFGTGYIVAKRQASYDVNFRCLRPPKGFSTNKIVEVTEHQSTQDRRVHSRYKMSSVLIQVILFVLV